MKWLIIWLVLVTLILIFNRGAHKIKTPKNHNDR